MIHREKHQKIHVPFANNRLFITFTLFLIIGLPVSFIPEETYGRWLIINVVVAVILTGINYVLWKRHQDDSKRYFSLHSLVMLLGLAFFCMAPLFKGLFPSIYFWLLLSGVIVFMAYVFSKSETIAEGILNSKLKGFSIMMYSYLGFVFFSAVLLLVYMYLVEARHWIPTAIVTFFIGIFFIMVSPAMLIRPERAIELQNRNK